MYREKASRYIARARWAAVTLLLLLMFGPVLQASAAYPETCAVLSFRTEALNEAKGLAAQPPK